VDHCRL